MSTFTECATGIGFFSVLCCLQSCSPVYDPVAVSRLIEDYKSASCVPFSANPRVTPHTREWEAPLTLRDGTKIVIIGAMAPGGRVVISYPAKHQERMAALPGDYVYPTDVRFDIGKEILYVKANGLAGGISEQTWLFEFDLRKQEPAKRLQVKNGSLPTECPEASLLP